SDPATPRTEGDEDASPEDETPDEPPTDDPTEPAPEPACGIWTKDLRDDGPGDKDFPHGMSTGGVRADSAVIWTHTMSPEKVRVLYSAGPDCEELETRWFDTEVDSGLNIKMFIDN